MLLTVTLSSLVLFTSLGGNTFAWDSPLILSLIAAAVVALVAFVLVEARASEPILPLPLFSNSVFRVTSIIGFIVGLAMFGSITFLPLYLQVVKGISPTASGLQLTPMMIGLLSTSIIAGQVMSRTGRYKILPMISLAILCVGMFLLSTLSVDTENWVIAVYIFIVGVGIGPVFSVSVTATQNAVDRSMLGVATAGSTLFRQIGGSIGVAVFGAIFANRLTAGLTPMLPAGSEVGGGLNPQMLAALPPEIRAPALAAFVDALHPVFLVATGAAVLAFVTSWFLKEIPLRTTAGQRTEVEIKAERDAAAGAVGAPSPEPEAT